MFFWKLTRSGKLSKKYISLVLDFHSDDLDENLLSVSLTDCENILILMQDVELINAQTNQTAGLLKPAFSSVVKMLGYVPTKEYFEQRNARGLIISSMVLGKHSGEPLDYGKSKNEDTKSIKLNLENLKISFKIWTNKSTFQGEDKLKAFRQDADFLPTNFYYDLMPQHSCMLEIVQKMKAFDSKKTENFLLNTLKWRKI